MDRLTAFGLFAVTAMLICYAFEDRSHWFVLGLPFLVHWDQPMAFSKAPGRLERWKRSGVWWPYGAGEQEFEINRTELN